MSTKLYGILTDEQAFRKLTPLIDKAVSIIHGQNQYKEDMKEIEQQVKSSLGLPTTEFKKVVKFVLSKNDDLSNEINSLNVISNIVEKINK